MPPTNDGFKRPSVHSDAFPRPAAQRVVPMSRAALEPVAPVTPRPTVMLDGVSPAARSTFGTTGAPEPQSSDSLESAPAVQQYDADALESSEPKVTEVDETELMHPDHLRLFRYNGLAMAVTGAVLVLIILIGASTLFLNSRHNNGGQAGSQANDYALGSTLPVGQVKNQLSDLSDDQLAVNGQLKINDTLVVTPTARPADPETGQIYYDQAANQPYYYDGKQFVSFAAQPGVTSLGGASGLVSVGGGLQVTNGQLALSPSATQALTGAVVNSLQGQTGNVTLAAGNGIGIDGTIISNTGLTGVSGTNGVAVSVAGGQVTIGLPQLLGAGDTPSFAGLSLANPLGVASGGTGSSSFNNGGVTYYNGSALVSTPTPAGDGLCLVSSPSGPQFGSCSGGNAVTSLNNLTGALTLQAGSGVTITDNGTNAITISATGATGANVGLSNLSGVAINTDLLPGTTNNVSLGSNTLRFKDLWLGGNGTIGGTLAVTGDVTGGTYNTAAISGGSLTGSSVNNLNVSGTAISGTGALSITAGGANQNLSLQGTGTGSVVVQTPVFHNANGATYSFDPADIASVNATICTTVGNCAGSGGGITGGGTGGTIPVFSGSGVSHAIGDSILTQSGSTVTAAGTLAATNLQGNGSGVTNVNAVTLQGNDATYFTDADNISSGTLSDSRLSGNVALLNGNNNFTGTTLQHNGSDVCDASNNCNYAPAGGGNNFILNGTAPQTADFNITGNGTLGTLSVSNTAGIGGTLTVGSMINGATISGGSLSGSAVNNLNVSGTAISGTGALSLSAGGTNQNLSLQGTGTGSVIVQTPLFHNANGATYSFDPVDGSGVNTTICTTVGNCAGTGGGIIASGTPAAGTIAVFTGANSIGNSQLSDSGTTLTYTGNMAIQGTNSLSLGTAGPAGKTGSIAFNNATNGNTLTLHAGATASNLTFTLPIADGSNGSCLQTNGAGVLSFQSCTGTGPGGGVTSVNGLVGVLHLQGTANQIGVTDNGSDTFTLALPQDIATTSSPSFAGLTATGTIQGGTVNATSALQLNGQNINSNGVLSNVAYLSYANNFSQNQTISANSGKTTLALTSTGTNTGITLGTDTTLYRSTNNTLKTDGTFIVGADLNVSGNSVLSGTLGVTGNTTLTGTLTVGTLGTNASTPLCADGSGLISTCSGGGGNSFILNGTAPQNANFNITGAGTVGGAFTGTGVALFKNTSTSAFQIQNAGGTSNLFIADTQNSLIGIGMQPTAGNGMLQIAGSVYSTGSLTLATSSETTFTTPAGASVPTKINIPLFDPGSSGQLIALGLPSGAASSARAIAVYDNRSLTGGQPNQPSIGVLSPNESNIFGLSWEATNTTGYLFVGSGGGIELKSGVNDLALWNSGGAATFKTASPVTNAFQLLDNNNVSYLQADSANHRLAVGIATAPAYTLDVGGDVNISSGSVYRVNGAAGATQTCTGGQVLQAASVAGGIITGTPTCGAAGSGINNSTSLQTAANFNVQSAATTSVTGQIRAIASQTADLLDFENSSGTVLSGFTASGALQGGNGSGTNGAGTNLVLAGGQGTGTGNGGNINFQIAEPGTTSGSTTNGESTVFSLSGNNGAALLQNATDSTTAFQIQNAAGSSMLNFDTTSGTLSVLGTSLSYIGGTDANGTSNGGTGSVAANGVAVSGQYEYTVSAGSNASCTATAGNATGCELKAFNITNPTAPVYLGGADSTGSTNSGTGGSGFTSIAISGHYAYVTQTGSNTGCGGTAGGAIGCELKVFDISNPATPTYVAGIDANGTLNSGGGSINFNSVAISGNDAYVASAANNSAACSQTTPSIGCELKVFDISTPTAPSYIGGADASGTTNGGTASTQSFDSVAVSGNYAYVAATGNATVCSSSAGSATGCELKDFDVSTPSAPTYLGGADASGTANSGGASNTFNSVAVSGGYIYVATASNNTFACAAPGYRGFGCELQAYDVSNPANPMYVGGADASGTTNGGTAAAAVSFNYVTAAGGYAYVAASGNSTACSGTAGSAIGCELQQYSVANPAAPTYTAGVDASGSTNSGTSSVQFNMVGVSGQNIYVASNASGTTCSGTAGTAIGCELKVFSNSGIQTTGLLSNSLETTSLQVDGSGQIFGSLTVGQSLRVNGDALFQDSTSSTTAFQVQGVDGQTVFDVDTANNRVCINAASCTNTLGVSGTIGASGSITANTTPDISETIPASADVTPGDVVSAGPDGNVDAVRSSVPYDPTTIGVISDGTSSFRINSNGGSADAPDTGKYLVLAGRVPVHVTDENGPIEPGDYLTTSSTPGYAMKATHAGPTIGKALAAFDGTSGTVMTQTNLSYYAGPSGADYVQNGGNATLSELTVGGMTNLAGLNVSGTATLDNLTVTGSATIGSLTVTGSASFAGNITVGGHIITSGTTPTVRAQAAAGAGAACTVTGNDTGGSITITTGTTGFTGGQECILTFHNDFGAAPNPVIAPRNNVSAQAQAFVDADTHTMTIEFSNTPAASTTYTFNYFNTQ